jgi:hypothetical protein
MTQNLNSVILHSARASSKSTCNQRITTIETYTDPTPPPFEVVLQGTLHINSLVVSMNTEERDTYTYTG